MHGSDSGVVANIPTAFTCALRPANHRLSCVLWIPRDEVVRVVNEQLGHALPDARERCNYESLWHAADRKEVLFEGATI